MNKKKKTLFKAAVLGLTAVATSLTIGMATACSKGGSSTTDSEDEKTTTKIDGQTIKNGNFEFYSDNKGVYFISSPDSWSGGTNGTSSTSMSGVIDTGKARWDYMTDPTLPQTLEDNDDLESGDKNKKDYNGALTDDLPYKNTHEAMETNAEEDKKAYIDNPFTHKYSYNEDGEVLDLDGNVVTTYTNDDGEIFLDDKFTQPLETSVLMLHNYHRGDYHGTESYYNSSTTISLEANTAAEISVWVKTAELHFGGASTDRVPVEFDRGAYIKVNTAVGGNSLDSFVIKNIDTEKLNVTGENNGWVEYTVYVEASSFAATTVSVTLGLGEYEQNTVEGYAFFDDVSITKYLNKEDMLTKCGAEFSDNIREIENDGHPNVSYPLATDAKTEFRVDVQKYQTDDGNGNYVEEGGTKENNSADRHFFIDFSKSTNKIESFELNSEKVTAGLTVEETNTGKYVCAEYDKDGNKFKTNGLGGISGEDDRLYTPNSLKNENVINLKDDLIATTTVGGEDWSFTAINTEYAALLTNALKTATDLPDAGANTDALVMLSARGAAYEAHINNELFTVKENDGCMLVSFWIKTSDMGNGTAPTITVRDKNDKTNSSSFSVDTTTVGTVTIGEGEDKVENVYKDWVRCFVRVSNTTDTAKTFEIVVNLGNTSIRNATRASYKYGWLAITNPSVMTLDKDVYAYTSGSSQTATLSFTEAEAKTANSFDTEKGEKNEIKTNLANPSSYTGVNGASSTVNPNGTTSLIGYNDADKNAFAGLLNKENFATYASRYGTDANSWYYALNSIAGTTNSDDLWDEVFGDYTTQPLLIVNSERTFDTATSQESGRYNYGFIGNTASVSSNAYTAVSVRVKASAGAVANVYLTENKKSGGEILSYVTPKYNYWYDDDGNILKENPEKYKDATADKQKENIAYTLRKDGLYENGDGKLYANFYNLTRHYDLSFEHENFYDEDGNPVVYNSNNIDNDKTYYADAAKTKYAPHYLIAGGKANNKVYMYNNGLGENASYYYVENGKVNKDKLVFGVDTTGEIAEMRYDNSQPSSTPYSFTIDTVANPEYANKWITVTFYIHGGSESKSYKLELWSGAREKVSSYTEGDYAKDSYVIFDYSDMGKSLDATTYSGIVGEYTDDVIAEYKKIIETLDDNDANIAELEKLATLENRIYDYVAGYYTYSLFDSGAFIPFNGETNKSGAGYSFNYSESEESLAYLKVIDDNDADAIFMSSFIDYSVVDKDYKIIGEPTTGGNDSSSGTSTGGSSDKTNVWLLASSIVLIVAIFIAIAAIFIRDFVKKHRGKKTAGKNSYNFNKNKRYVKKYVKANGEAPEIAEGEFDESLMSDAPAGGATAAGDATATDSSATAADAEETVDQPAVEKTPAESETTETPVEEEKPEDGDKEE